MKKISPSSLTILLSSAVVLIVSVVFAASEEGLLGARPRPVELPDAECASDVAESKSKPAPPEQPAETMASPGGGFKLVGTPLPDIDRSVLIQEQKEGKKINGPPKVISNMEDSLDALGTYMQAVADEKQEALQKDTAARKQPADYDKIPYEHGGLLVANPDTQRQTSIGVRQVTGENQYERSQTQKKIDGMILYLRDIVLVDRRYAAYGACKNQHESCAFWASRGECSMNAQYMVEEGNCALACLECPRLPDSHVIRLPEDKEEGTHTPRTYPKMPHDKTQRERDTERYEDRKRKRIEQEKEEARRKVLQKQKDDEYRRRTAHLTEKYDRQAVGGMYVE